MRLAAFIEPQLGASYADQLRIAQHAEDLGYDAFFRSDHFLTMGRRDGLPCPTDAWATLAAIAVQVIEQIGRFAEIGVSRVFLQILDLSDLDHLDVIASAVAPQLP